MHPGSCRTIRATALIAGACHRQAVRSIRRHSTVMQPLAVVTRTRILDLQPRRQIGNPAHSVRYGADSCNGRHTLIEPDCANISSAPPRTTEAAWHFVIHILSDLDTCTRVARWTHLQQSTVALLPFRSVGNRVHHFNRLDENHGYHGLSHTAASATGHESDRARTIDGLQTRGRAVFPGPRPHHRSIRGVARHEVQTWIGKRSRAK
jgi:hypothetical protein